MPSSKNTTNNTGAKATTSSSSSSGSKGRGSQGGTGVSKDFAESYGLKYHDAGDYQEAKNIQQALRDADKKYGRGK